MNFGQALEALKLGSRVSRAGWNGKGMWLHLVPGRTEPLPPGADDGSAESVFLPYISMRTAQGTFVPWMASQADVLADDWTIA